MVAPLLEPTTEKNSDEIKAQSYWESPEAKIMFWPQNGERVLNAIQRRVKNLKNTVNQHDGLSNIIEGFNVADENDDYYKPSDYDKFDIQMRCFFMIQLYQAVEEEIQSAIF